jgi:hypothetical protein
LATFLDLKTKVANEIHRSDLTDEVESAVLSAVQYYASQRFWFNESSGAFSTVANTAEYGSGVIPSGIIELDLVTLTVNGRVQELKPMPWQELAKTDQTNWSGIPYMYGWRAEAIRLYPVPNAVYTCTCYFLKEFPKLVNDLDTNVWTNEGFDLIKHRSKAELYDGVVYSQQQADRCRFLENETLQKMLKRTNILAASNTLVGDL